MTIVNPYDLTVPGHPVMFFTVRSEYVYHRFAPLTCIGVRLGVWLNRRVSETWFMRLVYALLFLSGLQLIWSGLAGR